MRIQRSSSTFWRALAACLLLVGLVQATSLIPLISHWACDDHCEAAADCHPDGDAGMDGCGESCGCLGCPAHSVHPALLVGGLQPDAPLARVQPVFRPETLGGSEPPRPLFRPPCA